MKILQLITIKKQNNRLTAHLFSHAGCPHIKYSLHTEQHQHLQIIIYNKHMDLWPTFLPFDEAQWLHWRADLRLAATHWTTNTSVFSWRGPLCTFRERAPVPATSLHSTPLHDLTCLNTAQRYFFWHLPRPTWAAFLNERFAKTIK